jgi:hypothetical protein
MLKGFDESLARALKTDRSTLFSLWPYLSPGEVEVVTFPADHPVPLSSAEPEVAFLREELISMLDRLSGAQMVQIIEIIQGFEGERAARVSRAIESLKASGFKKSPKRPMVDTSRSRALNSRRSTSGKPRKA